VLTGNTVNTGMQTFSSLDTKTVLKPVCHRVKRLAFNAHDYPSTIVTLDWH
jgi:hypothetical protein